MASMEFQYCLDSAMEIGELNINHSEMFDIIGVPDEYDRFIFESRIGFHDIVDTTFRYWYNNNTNQKIKNFLFMNFIFNSSYTLNEKLKYYSTMLADFYLSKKYKNYSLGISKTIREKQFIEIEKFFSFKKDIFKIKSLSNFLNNNEITFCGRKEESTKLFMDHLKVLNNNMEFDNLNDFFYNNSNFTRVKYGISSRENNLKRISKREIKASRKSLFRAYKALGNILSTKDAKAFINGEKIILEGSLFNYKLSTLKNKYSIMDLTINSNRAHIPYELNLFDKNDNYLANCCVYFKDTPILDQVISLYCSVKFNEKELITKTNLFSISEAAYKNEFLMENKFKKKFSKVDLQQIPNIERDPFAEISDETKALQDNANRVLSSKELIDKFIKKVENIHIEEKKIVEEKIFGLLKKSLFYKSEIPVKLRSFIFQPTTNLQTLKDEFLNGSLLADQYDFLFKMKKNKNYDKFVLSDKVNPNLLINSFNNLR